MIPETRTDARNHIFYVKAMSKINYKHKSCNNSEQIKHKTELFTYGLLLFELFIEERDGKKKLYAQYCLFGFLSKAYSFSPNFFRQAIDFLDKKYH